MEESLRGGLSLLMSGFGYWAHDIGGFEHTSTADVYKRWVAFGLLSSHSRLHGSQSYRVPWLYDEEAVDVVRYFTRLKARIMPYLYEAAIVASREGIPTMRSMVLEFTKDKNCSYLDKQYMLGDSLLVAPIFNEESVGEFYLPEGKWTSLFTGKVYEGGKWYSGTYDYLSLPLMVKENSILPMGACEEKPDYDYADGVELRIYELQESAGVTKTVYGMDGEAELTIKAVRTTDTITISVDAQKSYTVRLMNLQVAEADGAEVVVDGQDTVLKNCTGQIVVKL
jgi:alpha-D-xyloside xylohydrolase